MQKEDLRKLCSASELRQIEGAAEIDVPLRHIVDVNQPLANLVGDVGIFAFPSGS